jgi:hypothetical protein
MKIVATALLIIASAIVAWGIWIVGIETAD